jgi:hypothetical protein
MLNKKFKKLNEVQRLLLKWTDQRAYQDYKFQLKTQRVLPFHLDHPFKEKTHFKHSGNSGDIIYALPAVYALSKNKGAKLFLNIGGKIKYKASFHPLGNVMLNARMYEMLKPLLLFQNQVESCEIFEGQLIDYDLDIIRKHPFNLGKNSISRWYFHAFCIFADLTIPWLNAPSNTSYTGFIVIARSHRYRSPGINYSFLKKYKNKIFIGVPEEYQNMKEQLPDLEYRPVKDFLEMATIIKGSSLFIGNQSFPFSIAEGLKVRRVLELSYESPNVIMESKDAYDFYYQEHFEKIIETIYTSGNM